MSFGYRYVPENTRKPTNLPIQSGMHVEQKTWGIKALVYFWNTKIHLVYFAFHFMLICFPPNECPGLDNDQGTYLATK